MLLDRTEVYRCDGCGFKRENPIGWSALTPMVINTRVDFRSGVKHYCEGCTRAMPSPSGEG